MKRFCLVFLLAGFIFGTTFSTATFYKRNEETSRVPLPDDFRKNEVGQDSLKLICSCLPGNDLLQASGIKCSRCKTPLESVQKVCKGGGVLLLADSYPDKTQAIPDEVFNLAAKKHVRLYIEYPTALPGINVGKPQVADLMRGVITSKVFGSKLDSMSIVIINDCHFVPVLASSPYITLAKVAGFNKAVYGLPKDTWPVLFELGDGNILVSASKLSQFLTARYAPVDAWDAIWRMILGWVQPDLKINKLEWTPTIYPSYAQTELLPPDVERKAIRRGLEWVFRAHMLIHSSWKDRDWDVESQTDRFNPESVPVKNATQRFSLPTGDGSEGILEGYESRIHYDGRQSLKWFLRSDCSGEQAASFVLGGKLLNEPKWIEIGKNLHDFSLFKFDASAPWNDLKHPAFGLIGFRCPPSMNKPVDQTESFFGAIDSRICMLALTSAGLLNEDRWNDRVLQVMLANFRTTGQNGLREDALSRKDLEKNGWQFYYNKSNLTLAPYPAAQLLAMNLAVYKTTGYRPLLDRTELALQLLMLLDSYQK